MSESTELTTPTPCPVAWCEEHETDVFELGDSVHLGSVFSIRATLHDEDPKNTLDKASVVATVEQIVGEPPYVVLSDANGRVSSYLLLNEAEELLTALGLLVEEARQAQSSITSASPEVMAAQSSESSPV